MMRESELRIKYDTEVTDTSRECYAGEERGQPENVNLCKVPTASEPYRLSLRGIKKEMVRGLPSSEGISRPVHLGEGSFRIPRVSGPYCHCVD